MQILLKDITHIYLKGEPQEMVALKNLNLTLKGSGVIGLIGATGSGKSTLVQLVNGLIKPTKGQVLIDGEDINRRGAPILEIRKKVGLVFQYPEHQLFEETVYEDLAFGPKNLGLSGSLLKERVEESLVAVGLPLDILPRSPFHLSGGQKRRVAIAGVLAMRPQVLILDEPTAGLDPRGRREILLGIKKLQEERGLLVILVTHRMEEVAYLSHRILVLNRGELALDGTPKEIFLQAEILEKLQLDLPQITRVFDLLAKKGYPLSRDVLTVKEAKREILSLLRKGV